MSVPEKPMLGLFTPPMSERTVGEGDIVSVSTAPTARSTVYAMRMSSSAENLAVARPLVQLHISSASTGDPGALWLRAPVTRTEPRAVTGAVTSAVPPTPGPRVQSPARRGPTHKGHAHRAGEYTEVIPERHRDVSPWFCSTCSLR